MAEEIKWITVNHVHIPIMPGQTKQQAVDNFIKTLQESDENKRKTTKQLIKKLTDASIMEDKTQKRKCTINNRRKTISSDHYSRLRVMWSDYHRGASHPVEKDGVIFFNVDKTLYFTKGSYPDFYITQKRTFQSHELVTYFLKEISNGK